MVPDKEAEERVVRRSELEWTLVRPPRFVGSKPRGSVRVLEEGQRGRPGPRREGDLAELLIECVSERRYVGKALAVVS